MRVNYLGILESPLLIIECARGHRILSNWRLLFDTILPMYTQRSLLSSHSIRIDRPINVLCSFNGLINLWTIYLGFLYVFYECATPFVFASTRLSNLTYLVIIINRRRYKPRATHIDCYYYSSSLLLWWWEHTRYTTIRLSTSFHLNLIYLWWQLIKWNRKYSTAQHSPRSTIFPNRFLPRRKFRVEQFHRRLRNWCWHSEMAILAPLTNAAKTPGFSRTKRRCFRRSVVCTAGSMYMMPDVSGDILFGSPTFAIPLK